MIKRPLAITVVSLLFVLVGAGEIIEGPLRLHSSTTQPAAVEQNEVRDAVYVFLTGLVALAGGILTFRGSNWGRALLLSWMAFHIVLSILHSMSRLVVHGVLFAVILFFMFKASSSDYFKSRTAENRS